MRDTNKDDERVRRALEAVRRASESVVAEEPSPLTEVTLTGPARWQRDFEYWLPEQCRFVERYWSPTRDLHSDFTGWNVTRDCDLSTFSALLADARFYVEEVRGVAWCYGLVLAHLLTPEMAEARRPGRRDAEGRLVMDLTKEEE